MLARAAARSMCRSSTSRRTTSLTEKNARVSTVSDPMQSHQRVRRDEAREASSPSRPLCPKSWIFRTSWLFSAFGANFVKTMVRLAAEREELRVVADQFGRPTYAGDLARIIVAVVMGREPRNVLPFGLYHLGGGDPTTWHGFAIDILKRAHAIGLIDRMPSIEPIATAGYPTPARRPRYSVLAMNPEVVRVVGSTPDWHSGLEATFKALAESGRTK